MHFANQNLSYQIHQALNTQHVTVAFFKLYARCPENRTFKNYFRPTRANSWIRPGHLLIPYLRKRPDVSLSRYIALHKRKRNPILTTFKPRIIRSILEKLQHLRIHRTNPLSQQTKKTQNKPNFQLPQNDVSRFFKKGYCSLATVNCQKNKPNQTQIAGGHTLACNNNKLKCELLDAPAPPAIECTCDLNDRVLKKNLVNPVNPVKIQGRMETHWEKIKC